MRRPRNKTVFWLFLSFGYGTWELFFGSGLGAELRGRALLLLAGFNIGTWLDTLIHEASSAENSGDNSGGGT